MGDKLAPTTRHKFEHEGRTIYEWDQTYSEVNIYVQVPPNIRAKELYCDVQPTTVRLGIRPNPPYLDVSGVIHQHALSDCLHDVLLTNRSRQACDLSLLITHPTTLQHKLAGPAKASESFWTLGKWAPTTG